MAHGRQSRGPRTLATRDRPPRGSLQARARRISTFETMLLDSSKALRSFARLAHAGGERGWSPRGISPGPSSTWHRALLRSEPAPAAIAASLIERLVGIRHPLGRLRPDLNPLGVRPGGSTRRSVRRALDEVIAIDAMTPPRRQTSIKWEYHSIHQLHPNEPRG